MRTRSIMNSLATIMTSSKERESSHSSSLRDTNVLTKGVGGVVGATFAVEPDPFKAADLMIDHIQEKRKGLGLKS